MIIRPFLTVSPIKGVYIGLDADIGIGSVQLVQCDAVASHLFLMNKQLRYSKGHVESHV